jgi:hypothetical protein
MYKVQTKLPVGFFTNLTTYLRTKKEDLINAVQQLRSVGLNRLEEVAKAVNAIDGQVRKVVNVFDPAEWPEWCQAIFYSKSSAKEGMNAVLTEANKRIKTQTLTKEDKAFWDASCRVTDKTRDALFTLAKVSAWAEFTSIFRMMVVDGQSKPNPEAFYHTFISGEAKVETLYEPPKVVEKKKAWSDVLKSEPKQREASEPKYVSGELLTAWKTPSPQSEGLRGNIPEYVQKMYVIRPMLTVALTLLNFLLPGMEGIEKARQLEEIPDSKDLKVFWEKMYRLKFVPNDEEASSIRQFLRNGKLFAVAREARSLGTYFAAFKDLSEKVSTLPAVSGAQRKSKRQKGEKASSGASSSSGNGSGRPAAEQRKNTGGNAGAKGKGTKKPAVSSNNSGSGKTQKDNKSGPKSSTPKPTAPKQKAGEADKESSRSVAFGPKSYRVSDLLGRIKQAKDAGKDSLVIDNGSFKLGFLGKLLANPEVQRIGSRWDGKGVARKATTGATKK